MTEQGHLCINDEIVECITFKDGDRILGTLRCDGSQQCTNGYRFEITRKTGTVKEE